MVALKQKITHPIDLNKYYNVIKMESKIHHFYHLWLGGSWLEIFHSHLTALINHGLMAKLDIMHIGLVGDLNEREIAKRFLDAMNVKYKIVAETDIGYEQITQTALLEFSKHNEGYVLYAHNKGASDPSDINVSWRKSMTYHNIVQWRTAISHLTDKDAVGCHWLTHDCYPIISTPYFAGTFWWTHLSIIRELGYPNNNSRYDAEIWLGQYPNLDVYDLCPGWPSHHIFTTTW
jgi:hypothetical protein